MNWDIAKLKIDGKIKFVTIKHCSHFSILGEINRLVFQQLLFGIFSCAHESVPLWGAWVGPEFKNTASERCSVPISDLPEFVNDVFCCMNILLCLSGKAQ